MVYGPRKKKISQFTAGTAITDDVKYSSLQDGINKTFTQEQLIADFADVYGASLRTFEFESDLVVSDIQIDEYCIVEENRYTLYKITSAAANLPNIALDSGFTAERVRILQQASPSTYAEILAENPDLYAEDDVIYLSGDGIAGDFKVVTGAISASSTGVLLSNATWNAAGKHLARGYSGALNVRWFGALPSASSATNTTAFQAAIDIAKVLVDSSPSYETTGTAAVYVPAGNYSINTITLDAGVIFYGDGQANTILSHAGTGLTDIIASSSSGDNMKTSIYGMWLKGNGVTNTRYGLELSGGFYSNVIQDVLITDCQYGMYLTDCFTLTMKNCHSRANTYGCYWYDGNSAYIENTRFEGNTNYQLKIEEAKSIHINVGIFQFAESDDACILTGCVGATLTDCQFEGNNVDDNSYADLNISGSVACINGGFWTQSTLTSNTTGIAIKANLAVLAMNGVMITPTSNHATGLQLNFTGAWGVTTLTGCQIGEGGVDDSNYAGHLYYTNLGYGASPELGDHKPHFLSPTNRNGGIIIGNKTHQSRICHPDSRGTYSDEVLLITSPEHTDNNNNTDHTMMLDTRNQVQASISGITKGATTTITCTAAHRFRTGWTVDIASITDSGAGDLETALNGNSYSVTVVDSTSFTVAEDTSAVTATWSSGGTATRPAKQTVHVKGTYDKAFYLGSYALWVDSTGDLRINNGVPATDTSGTVVGTQS